MPGNWQAGASQPSRATGTIFLYTCLFLSGEATYRKAQRVSKSANSCTSNAVMFYILFPNKRIRAHCRVTCTTAGRFAHHAGCHLVHAGSFMPAVNAFMQAASAFMQAASVFMYCYSVVPSTLHQPFFVSTLSF